MCNISQNLSVSSNLDNLGKMLNSIKPTTVNNDPQALRCLYIPQKMDDKNSTVHALYNGGHVTDGNTDLYLSPLLLS
jgi:hypothetical protein